MFRPTASSMLSILIVPLLLGSCATRDYSNISECESLRELAPLPDAPCREDLETIAFEERLTEAMEDDLGSLLVRATLDDRSQVGSLCVDGPPVPGGFRKRANISERFPEFAALPSGPACMGGRRIDLNRREAMRAKIKRRESECDSESQPVGVARSASGARVDRRRIACMDYRANWIMLYELGRRHPLIFAWPEILQAPKQTAGETRIKCNRKRRPEAIAACIVADGWELLE